MRKRTDWTWLVLSLALALPACSDDASAGSGSGSGGSTSSTTTTVGSGGAGGSGGMESSSAGGSGGTGGSGESLVVTSSAFKEGEKMSTLYTCAGQDISPPLAYTAGPAGTQGYAVVMRDLDVNLIHWAIWDIPSSTFSMPSSVAGAKQATSFDPQTRGYMGPCPPATHHYKFTVYAVDASPLDALGMGSSRDQAEAEIKAHALASGSITGLGDPK